MLDVKGLKQSHEGRTVLQIDRWQLPAGRSCCITGPSGSGKTTLLDLLCALRRPVQGEIRVSGVDVARLSGRAADRWRGATVGVVTQTPHLLDILTVQENVLLAAQMARKAVDRPRAEMLLARLGLDALATQRPSRLSQGQRQRVVLARALLCRPMLLIADEPTAHLDDASCEALCSLMLESCSEAGATLLVATHDQRIVPLFDQQLPLAAPEAAACRRARH